MYSNTLHFKEQLKRASLTSHLDLAIRWVEIYKASVVIMQAILPKVRERVRYQEDHPDITYAKGSLIRAEAEVEAGESLVVWFQRRIAAYTLLGIHKYRRTVLNINARDVIKIIARMVVSQLQPSLQLFATNDTIGAG